MSDDKPESLSEEIARAKAARDARIAPKQRDVGDEANTAGALALRYGAEFGASVFVGIVFGLLIDHFFETEPWGLLVMLGFGLAAGILNVVRAYRQLTVAPSDETDAPKTSTGEKIP